MASPFTPATIPSGSSSGLTVLYSSTLGSTTASIDTGANGVASGYSAIYIRMLLRSTTAAATGDLRLRFNNDSGGSNYWTQINARAGTTPAGDNSQASGLVLTCAGGNLTSTIFSVYDLLVPAYTGSQLKVLSGTFLYSSGNFAAGNSTPVGTAGGMWNDASAITRVAIVDVGSGLAAGSQLVVLGQI